MEYKNNTGLYHQFPYQSVTKKVKQLQQIEWVYNQLQSLSSETLVQIIDELKLDIPDNKYKSMATDVYSKAKQSLPISDKQKRVLVNIIGQPRY